MSPKLRAFIKDWCPPALLRWLRALYSHTNGSGLIEFTGNYPTWQKASADASGYAAPDILEKARQAMLKVKRGEVACERDTVTFDQIEYSYPLLAHLLSAAGRNGERLRVLDFGGALGSSYYQNRACLAHLNELHWMVVEQAHFVTCGKAEFSDGKLEFYETITAATEEGQPDLVLLSSVLQYLEHPRQWIEKIKAAGARWILVDRSPMLFELPTRLTLQTVPPSIYRASYPCWIFNEQTLISWFSPQYRLADQFDANIGSTIFLKNAMGRHRGYLFEGLNI